MGRRVWHKEVEDDVQYLAAVAALRQEASPPSKQLADFCSRAHIPLPIHLFWLDGGVDVWGNWGLVKMKDGGVGCWSGLGLWDAEKSVRRHFTRCSAGEWVTGQRH